MGNKARRTKELRDSQREPLFLNVNFDNGDSYEGVPTTKDESMGAFRDRWFTPIFEALAPELLDAEDALGGARHSLNPVSVHASKVRITFAGEALDDEETWEEHGIEDEAIVSVSILQAIRSLRNEVWAMSHILFTWVPREVTPARSTLWSSSEAVYMLEAVGLVKMDVTPRMIQQGAAKIVLEAPHSDPNILDASLSLGGPGPYPASEPGHLDLGCRDATATKALMQSPIYTEQEKKYGKIHRLTTTNPLKVEGGTSATWSFWCKPKPRSVGEGHHVIYKQPDSVWLGIVDGRFTINLTMELTTGPRAAGAPVSRRMVGNEVGAVIAGATADVWSHVVFTLDATGHLRGYLNGTESFAVDLGQELFQGNGYVLQGAEVESLEGNLLQYAGWTPYAFGSGIGRDGKRVEERGSYANQVRTGGAQQYWGLVADVTMLSVDLSAEQVSSLHQRRGLGILEILGESAPSV